MSTQRNKLDWIGLDDTGPLRKLSGFAWVGSSSSGGVIAVIFAEFGGVERLVARRIALRKMGAIVGWG